MYIEITTQDMWNEFVYYRKVGLHETAFSHIRVYDDPMVWYCVLAGVAYKNYDVAVGDIINMKGTRIEFPWTEQCDKVFKQNSLPSILQDPSLQDTGLDAGSTTP